ncbi:hypothetical protein [Kitasatospora sp. NPDC085464]|uniref:hypothetical protein n=1 Tax=Kitasatospora sp. NPDC085464 TaxID=3364063 RepID=UPI0037C6452D
MAAVAITGIEARTARYRADGIEVCWFTDRNTVPWLDAVPCVQALSSRSYGEVTSSAL